jgi:hypothetical protein
MLGQGFMPRIRIVEEWLRHPAAPATRWRSIMVVAEAWGEQRVLMKAYAESVDQTRPTIVLHGIELAIGPAGTDPHGAWGIHVHPQVDGRAQEISESLREAARRVAGSKGNPARLADEVSDFERKRTDNWAPGTPRGVPGGAADSRNYFEPMVAASSFDQPAYASSYDQAAVVAAQSATLMPQSPQASFAGPSGFPVAAAVVASTPSNPQDRLTPLPVAANHDPSAGSTHSLRRRRGWTSPIKPQGAEPGGRTALGYESGAGAQSAVIRLGLRPGTAAQLGRIVDRTVPSHFEISPHERDVLNALGDKGMLTAAAIGALVGTVDPIAWMEQLMRKLVEYGLDIVVPGATQGGEPTYRLHV